MALLLPSAIRYQEIPTDDYIAQFNDRWRHLSRRFLKIEYEQLYVEPDDESYIAYSDGRMTDAIQLFRNRLDAELVYLQDIPKKNLDYTRLRLIKEPISSYMVYELQTYVLSATYGQRIFIKDITKFDPLIKIGLPCDAMVFDDQALVLQEYESGKCVRILEVTDRQFIADYVRDIESVIRESTSVGAYQRSKNRM